MSLYSLPAFFSSASHVSSCFLFILMNSSRILILFSLSSRDFSRLSPRSSRIRSSAPLIMSPYFLTSSSIRASVPGVLSNQEVEYPVLLMEEVTYTPPACCAFSAFWYFFLYSSRLFSSSLMASRFIYSNSTFCCRTNSLALPLEISSACPYSPTLVITPGILSVILVMMELSSACSSEDSLVLVFSSSYRSSNGIYSE